MSRIFYNIRQQELNISIPVPVVSNYIDYLDVNCNFSPDWAGTVKTVFFNQGDLTYKILLRDDTISKEKHINLSSGIWYTWVMGDIYAENGSIQHRITTNIVQFTVLESGVIDDNIIAIPPDAGEQILGVATSALDIANEALKEAQSVVDRANKGDFNGAAGGKGAKGDKGDTGADGKNATIVGATATVDESTGTPTVNVVSAGTEFAREFEFYFSGIKGEKGETGEAGKDFKILGFVATADELPNDASAGDAYGVGENYPYDIYIYDGITNTWVNNGTIQGPKGEQGESAEITGATASVDANVGTPNVIVTAGGDTLHRTFDFAFKNLKGETGEKGDAGEAATITGATATVDNSIGNPAIVVTPTGTPNAQSFDFAFSGIKGEQGEKGDKGDSGVYVGSETIPAGYNVKINPAGNETDIADYLPAGSVTRVKLAMDALYSPMEYFFTTYSFSINDVGKTIVAAGTSECVATLTQETNDAMPLGAEINVFWLGGANVKLQFAGDMRIVSPSMNVVKNGSVNLKQLFTFVTLKKITVDASGEGDIWYLDGDVTVETTETVTTWENYAPSFSTQSNDNENVVNDNTECLEVSAE